MKIIFITGASGSGKTTLVRKIQEQHPDDFGYYFFDSIGVPSQEEMIAQYGSGDEWQKQTTAKWVQKILRENYGQFAILDGQMRLAFIEEACKAKGLENYTVILIDCDDATRARRLIERGHPELANPVMMNWAKYLRTEAADINAKILNTSDKTSEESIRDLLQLIND